MSAATASVANVSRSRDLIRNNSWESSNAGGPQNQCSPFPLPVLGTQKIIQGNGTTVGTVISLQCPAQHKLVGSELKCIMGSNTTEWVGAPYCKPLSSDLGFRVAVLASIVSSGIILFMSVAFITCCLLDCLKDGDRKKQRELDLRQWEEVPLRQEDVGRPRKGSKGKNNNNNNGQMPLWDAHDPVHCGSFQNCRFEPPPLHPLPGIGCEQPQTHLNSTALTSNYRPPSSRCQSSGSSHVSAGRGSVWQCEHGRVPGAGARNKEFSIRIISV